MQSNRQPGQTETIIVGILVLLWFAACIAISLAPP